jgi:hypothetical protein
MAMADDQDATRTKDSKKAYNVYRTGLLVFSSLYAFFFAGAFFGYGPMVLLLQEDEAFLWKCGESNSLCPDQMSSILNVHFVATLMQVLSPFVGHLCDTRGPFAGMIYTTLTGLIGVCLLITSRALPLDQLLYPTFCFLGMCSNATSVMIIFTGGVFGDSDDHNSHPDDAAPSVESEGAEVMSTTGKNSTGKASGESSSDDDKNKGTRRVIGLLNNLYDAGTVTYLILWKIQEATGASLQLLAWGYLGVALVTFGGALIFWNLVLTYQGNDQTKAIADGSNPDRQEKNTDAIQSEQTQTESGTKEDGDEEVSENKEDWKQLRSTPYLFLVSFFAFHICRNQFMLTSSESFLTDLGDDDNKYITIFALIMPASIVGFPFVDFALGRYGYHASLQLINVLAVIHGIIQVSTSNLNIQVIGFVVFSFYRCFLFSVIFAFLAVLMPQHLLGKANGLMHVCSGVLGFLNIPLGNAAIQQWNGSFFIPNLIYTILILPFFYVAYGTTAGIRNKEKELKQQEGNDSRRSGFTKRASSAFNQEEASNKMEVAAA